MYEGTREAKRFLFANVVTNLTAVVITSLVGFWMTPFLIHFLGVKLFGMVSLASALIAYAGLMSLTLSSSVGRFVTLHLNRGEFDRGNIYFNSSLVGLIAIGLLLITVAVIVAPYLHYILNVPVGFEKDFRSLFILMSIASFMSAVTSPFLVSTFVTHRFYLLNSVKIVSRLGLIAIVAGCFVLLQPSLIFVGLGYLGMATILLFSMVILTRRLTPELSIGRRYIRWKALREVSGMGAWIVIDQVGSLLYLNTDLIVINLLLGTEPVGYYAPVLQLVLLLRVYAPALESVFAPVAIDLIAQRDYRSLIRNTCRAVKFMGVAVALPAALICGMSGPLLKHWLGDAFVEMAPLVWLLLAPQTLFLAMLPLYNINRGMNKVRIPALVTLAGGVLNVILSATLVLYSGLGVYGVALATVFSYSCRSVLFLPVYVASYLSAPRLTFLKQLTPGAALFLVTSLSCHAGVSVFSLTAIPEVLILACGSTLLGLLFMIFGLLDREERVFLARALKLDKLGFFVA